MNHDLAFQAFFGSIACQDLKLGFEGHHKG